MVNWPLKGFTAHGLHPLEGLHPLRGCQAPCQHLRPFRGCQATVQWQHPLRELPCQGLLYCGAATMAGRPVSLCLLLCYFSILRFFDVCIVRVDVSFFRFYIFRFSLSRFPLSIYPNVRFAIVRFFDLLFFDFRGFCCFNKCFLHLLIHFTVPSRKILF